VISPSLTWQMYRCNSNSAPISISQVDMAFLENRLTSKKINQAILVAPVIFAVALG
jgi:hypothetical protein